MTEKRKLTYDLDAIRAVFSTAEALSVTDTALKTAAALGFSRQDIVATIQTIQRTHFYKSMTSHRDHRI
jgi:motility quorum-sensing regulator/GCU-specific mRNA interferase toxin